METKNLPFINDVKVQTICYILSKLNIPSVDKIKLIKLIFLADKYHLLNYARTITDDTYYAMPYGPVGGDTLNLLNKSLENPFFFLNEENHKVIKREDLCNFNMLSDTDKISLDIIIDKFAKYETWDLTNLSHEYPEWKKHKDYVLKKKARVALKTEELISVIPEDGFNIPEERLKILREIINQ
ncbi:MAG: SocA family protein [Endomicrobium sp.]|jgi:uncharacterized phage-associated protein|nr:SocA family protein [Endomicrobium sp.]